MKFTHPPVHTLDPGPWGVCSAGRSWYVVHSVTLRAKRIGVVGAKRANYFDQAVREATRRNKEHQHAK